MRVVNYKHPRDWAADKSYVIMRPSAFGNPYRIGRDGTRKQVLEKFKKYAERSGILKHRIMSLPEDAVLVCCCKPEDCHGDIIVEMWYKLHGKQLPGQIVP